MKHPQKQIERRDFLWSIVSAGTVHHGQEDMVAIEAWSVTLRAFNMVDQAAEPSAWKPKAVRPQSQRFQYPKTTLPSGDGSNT